MDKQTQKDLSIPNILDLAPLGNQVLSSFLCP